MFWSRDVVSGICKVAFNTTHVERQSKGLEKANTYQCR